MVSQTSENTRQNAKTQARGSVSERRVAGDILEEGQIGIHHKNAVSNVSDIYLICHGPMVSWGRRFANTIGTNPATIVIEKLRLANMLHQQNAGKEFLARCTIYGEAISILKIADKGYYSLYLCILIKIMESAIFRRLTHFCHQLIQRGGKGSSAYTGDAPTVVPRQDHNISRSNIDPNALKVLYRLRKEGYQAFLVGGGVRDLLLGRQPKDFDIATDATPEQIRALFRNCRLVGRRFRLAHILFGRDVIEVATFRGEHPNGALHNSFQTKHGRLLRDNIYGSIVEDAKRRDFTVNSIYYNIADFSLLDYTGGLLDLERGVIRLIGDAETRYREDPVRMLRAVRFAAKLQMQLSEETGSPISRLTFLLREVPAARLFEESLKLLQSGDGYATYKILRKHQLFSPLFPMVESCFETHYCQFIGDILGYALKGCDERIATTRPVNPAFLFAAMLWYPLLLCAERNCGEGDLFGYSTFMTSINQTIKEQSNILAIPKWLANTMREIWQLQPMLACYRGKRASRLLSQPKFRAAYDLLLLRSMVEGGKLMELARWWGNFQLSNPRQSSEPRPSSHDPSW